MYDLQGDCFLMGKSEHLHYKGEKDGKEYNLQAGCLWCLQGGGCCQPARWEARSRSSARRGQGLLLGLSGVARGQLPRRREQQADLRSTDGWLGAAAAPASRVPQMLQQRCLPGWAIFSSSAHPSRRGPIRSFLLHCGSLDQYSEAALLMNAIAELEAEASQTHPWMSLASCSEAQCLFVFIRVLLTSSLALEPGQSSHLTSLGLRKLWELLQGYTQEGWNCTHPHPPPGSSLS